MVMVLSFPLNITVVGKGLPERGKSRQNQGRWGRVGSQGRAHVLDGEGMTLIIIAGVEQRSKMSTRLRGTARGIGALSGTLCGHEPEGKTALAQE